jgi:hypothetical protein
MKQTAKKGEGKVLEFQAVTEGKFLFYCDACGGLNSSANVAAADKDIKNTKQFSAAEIDIQPAPVMAPTTVAPLSTPSAVTPPAAGQPVK